MSTLIEKVTRKSMIIRPSGRSTDFISPSIIYECGFQCSYCYVKRHGQQNITVAKNIGDIMTAINNHAMFTIVDKPNQTHEKYISYDIGCNSDMSLHAKNYEWKRIFDFFKQHPIAMGSFATKYVNVNLLDYNPEGKIRIRFSLMPQTMSDKLEPNTSKIIDRIKAIDAFVDAGYDVHINFSPVIVAGNWLEEYKDLFYMVNEYVDYKDVVKAEVIFLTHNEGRHKYNLDNGISGEDYLWVPTIQEDKISQYGGKNIRYKRNLKSGFIDSFTKLHDSIIPWNTIRYIF
jgi:spore photoproduct lyase